MCRNIPRTGRNDTVPARISMCTRIFIQIRAFTTHIPNVPTHYKDARHIACAARAHLQQSRCPNSAGKEPAVRPGSGRRIRSGNRAGMFKSRPKCSRTAITYHMIRKPLRRRTACRRCACFGARSEACGQEAPYRGRKPDIPQAFPYVPAQAHTCVLPASLRPPGGARSEKGPYWCPIRYGKHVANFGTGDTRWPDFLLIPEREFSVHFTHIFRFLKNIGDSPDFPCSNLLLVLQNIFIILRSLRLCIC